MYYEKPGTVFDQSNDLSQCVLNQALHKIANEDLSNFVKEECLTAEKIASETTYALSDKQLFPVSTLEDTVLSKVYFEHQREKLADYQEVEAEQVLDTYLNLYNIPEELFTNTIEKAASENIEHCLLPTLGICKVASAEDLENVGTLFERDYKNLEIAQRVEFASNFVKAASDFGVKDYPSKVATYIGTLDTDINNLQTLLEARASAASLRGESGEDYTKLAFALKDIDLPTSAELTKLAEVIHSMDEEHNFTDESYDHRLPDAYHTVFNKEADTTPEDVKNPAHISKSEIIAQYGEDALEALEDNEGNLDTEKLKNLGKIYG